ncbi:aldose 1-epimerase [Paralcaligenes sp. KSB-10]|uniref:aldose 1-epimerase n=1 Tax=Paralcaligenes sp. KSB-10 TaxID=2901142 RepID=UPI001E3AF23B|nr:aldose 1-epimerase [Paralcaligenes sp. KSB-10]UHL64421.1 aldose 1-epimerase [Paralcaligenes sp. KSB-10]
MPTTTSLLHLNAGQAELVLAPQIGGSIVAYRDLRRGETVNWLRPVPMDAVTAGAVSAMASFPLVPWSSRLRNGTFMFEGRQITLPPNSPSSPHAIHGIGRYKPWQIVHATPSSALLRYEHVPDAWPFSFVTEQEFALNEHELSIVLRVRNTGDQTMPAGIGHHPYFPRNAHTTLTTSVGQAWFNDQEVMPLYIAPHPAASELAHGTRVDDHVLDNVFLDWSHHAVIHWPDQARFLTMHTDTPFDYVVLYSPSGVDWFCVEPVSNTTDCFNLMSQYPRHEVGGTLLQPGQELAARVSLRTEFHEDRR